MTARIFRISLTENYEIVCNVPVCGASRASLLTGLRPTRRRFTSAHTKAEEHAPNATAIQSLFKNNGYYTIANGKIYQHVTDYKSGWSQSPWRPNGEWWGWQAYLAEESYEIIRNEIKQGNTAPGPFSRKRKPEPSRQRIRRYGQTRQCQHPSEIPEIRIR